MSLNAKKTPNLGLRFFFFKKSLLKLDFKGLIVILGAIGLLLNVDNNYNFFYFSQFHPSILNWLRNRLHEWFFFFFCFV
jgi:hypothetical protein